MSAPGPAEIVARALDAWNRGELTELTGWLAEDHEWDLTRSYIPGENQVYRGREAYLGFARRWREALGPSQLELEEVRELPDGRLFTLIRQTATGVQSGASVDLRYVQISTFAGAEITRTEVFGDHREGRAAAGLDG